MRESQSKAEGTWPRTTSQDNTAQQKWESEGGATLPQGQTPVKAPVQTSDPGPQKTPVVNAIQDDLMAVASSEGAPPPRGWRLEGSHWLVVVGLALVVLGGLVWVAFTKGVLAALAGLALVVVMLGAAVPVWGAGLLRGAEERRARAQARAAVGAHAPGKRSDPA